MQETVLIAIDGHPVIGHRVAVRIACQPDQQVIGFFGEQNTHIDTSCGGGIKSGLNIKAGDEIGTDNPEAFSRPSDCLTESDSAIF